MILHFAIISLQAACLAAFLILWYFWVKRKMDAVFALESEEQALFPFRHFSWVLLGLVLVTSLAQIHFVRVSSQVHEKMAVMSEAYTRQEQTARALADMKVTVEKLRRDMDSNFKGLKALMPDQVALLKPGFGSVDTGLSEDVNQSEKVAPTGPHKRAARLGKDAFAGEAKASSANTLKTALLEPPAPAASDPDEAQTYSMTLNRQGRILKDRLRVRKHPGLDAPAVEHLMSGQQVKVTEKRVSNENVWFRVVTPSGRAGWINYRYVKLEGGA
jgi:hypothetical protein